MRVPERMIIEGHVQLVMNHSGTVLKGVRADEFPVLSDAQEIHALQRAADTALNRNNPVYGISFFIFLRLQIMIGIIFTIEQPVLLLGQLRMFQCLIEGISKFDGTDGIDCFRCSKVPGRLSSFFPFCSSTFRTSTP